MTWADSLTTHDLIWLGVYIGFALGVAITILVYALKMNKESEASKE